MAAVITIDADTANAQRELDDLSGTLRRAREGVRDFGKLNAVSGAVTAIASSVTAAASGFQMVASGARFARDAIQAYFESSAEGKAIWEQIDMQFKSVLGTIGELILGTSDVAEAGELVRDIMSDVTAVIRGLGAAVGPLVDVMRTGLLGVLDAVASMFGRAKGEADEYAAATARVTAELRSLEQQTSTYEQTLVESVQGADQYQVIMGVLEDITAQATDQVIALTDAETGLYDQGQILNGQLRSTADQNERVQAAVSGLREQMLDALIATGDLDRGFGSLASEVGAFGVEVARVEVDNFRERLEGLNVIVGGQSVPFFQIYNHLLGELQQTIEGNTGAQGDAAAAAREAAEAQREAAERARRLAEAQREAARAARELELANRRGFADSLRGGLDRLTEYGQSYMDRIEERAEAEREAAQALADRLREIDETRAAEQAARDAAEAQRLSELAAAREAYTTRALASATELVAGEGDLAKRARKVLGQGISDAGAAGLKRAGMMAFTPGMQGAALGLTAASLAAIALGRKFGASGGGAGGGRGGGNNRRTAIVTQNITFGGGAAGQDRRSIARSIERASRDGVIDGLGV